jgi:hypothetical protein
MRRRKIAGFWERGDIDNTRRLNYNFIRMDLLVLIYGTKGLVASAVCCWFFTGLFLALNRWGWCGRASAIWLGALALTLSYFATRLGESVEGAIYWALAASAIGVIVGLGLAVLANTPRVRRR